jgi:hypothetical protein
LVSYDLRHSFASLLIAEGRSVVEVAAQLGHAPASGRRRIAEARAGVFETCLRRERPHLSLTEASGLAYRGIGRGPMTNWTDWADAVASLAQALAIVLGGLWAYFKFLRGRTFAHRLEVGVDASAVRTAKGPGLRVKATMKNVGLTRLTLRLATLSLSAIQATAGDIRECEYKTVPVFTKHRWVEANETITDEALLLVPAEPDLVGLRLECEAIEQRRWRGGGLAWQATTVVPFDGAEREQAPEREEVVSG